MPVEKIRLPNSATVDIHDARVVSEDITYIGDVIGSATYEADGSVVDISDYAKKVWVEGKGYLTEHQPLKTINNQSIIGTGNITISGGSGGGEENVIESISVNGSSQTPDANKNVDITIPTKVSDLSNDSGFITDSGVVKTSGNQTIGGTKTFSAEVVMTAGGTSDITSGVLCAFKTNRAQITNFATHNILTGGTNSTTPITFYKYTAVSSQAPSSLVQLAKIDTDGNIYEGTVKLSDKYLTSYTETDPTVPSWAKQPTKPTYTASEVGALPDTTAIPTKTSDLTNDSGFITGYTETDPTVPAWAKAATKPTYTASEVGALPSSTSIPSALSDLSADSTHRTVTDTEKSTWNNKQNAITISSSEPTSSQGSNGDIWIVI